MCLVLSACGGTTSPDKGDGGNGDSTDNNAGTTNPTAPQATRLDLIASSLALESASIEGDGGVTLTAIVRDQNNNAVPSPDVSFNADSGLIQIGSGGADNGTATATLYNEPDRANRTITVTATIGGLRDTINIAVVGTQLQLEEPSGLAVNQTADFTATLVDSSGKPIANTPLKIDSLQNSIAAGVTTALASTGDAQATRNVRFALKEAAILTLNTSKATVGVTDVNSRKDSVTLTATVRDRYGNRVKEGNKVRFGPSPTDDNKNFGSLSVNDAETGADGRVSTVYTPTRAALARKSVAIGAMVDDSDVDHDFLAEANQTSVKNDAEIAVVREALNVKLGSGGPPKLSSDGTTYSAPYAAIVTDEGGNPASNGILNLNF